MAGPGVTQADQVRREDLSDAMIVADDRNVTLLPRMRKGPKMRNSPYGWSVKVPKGRRTAPVPEGIDVYAFESDTGKTLHNRKQKIWRTPMVTTEAEELDGLVGSQLDYEGQKAQAVRDQAFDLEAVILSDQDAQETKNVKDKGEAMMGLGRAINDTTSVGAAGVALTFGDSQTAIPPEFRTPTAQIWSDYLLNADGSPNFSQDKANDLLRSRYDQLGGSPELSLFVGSLLKSFISGNWGRFEPNKVGYTVVTRLTRSAMNMTKGIDVFEGDNGTLDITQCQFMPFTTRGYILDMMDVRTRPLLYCRHSMLPYQGAGLEGLVETIMGYEFGSPLKQGKIDPLAYQHP